MTKRKMTRKDLLICIGLLVVTLVLVTSLISRWRIESIQYEYTFCDELPTTLRIDAALPTNFSLTINNSFYNGGVEEIDNITTPFILADSFLSDFDTAKVVMINFGQNTEINIKCKDSNLTQTFKLECVGNVYYNLKC